MALSLKLSSLARTEPVNCRFMCPGLISGHKIEKMYYEDFWWSRGLWGFPGSSAGKESACNAGDPSSTPRSGRSPGEGIGNPLQYSWVSLVGQLVKNPPAMQDTWFQSLDWKDPLEKGKTTHPLQYSGLEKSMDCIVHGVAKSQTQLHLHFFRGLSTFVCDQK